MRFRRVPSGLASLVLLFLFILPIQPRGIPNGARPDLNRRFLRSLFAFGRAEEPIATSHEVRSQATAPTVDLDPLDLHRDNQDHERVQAYPDETAATPPEAGPDPDVEWPPFYHGRPDVTHGPPGVEEVTKHVVHEERFDRGSFRPVQEEARGSHASRFLDEPQIDSALSSPFHDHRSDTGLRPDANPDPITGTPSTAGRLSRPLPQAPGNLEVLQDLIAYIRSLRQAQPTGPLRVSTQSWQRFVSSRRSLAALEPSATSHRVETGQLDWYQLDENLRQMAQTTRTFVESRRRFPSAQEISQFQQAQVRALALATALEVCGAEILGARLEPQWLAEKVRLLREEIKGLLVAWDVSLKVADGRE